MRVHIAIGVGLVLLVVAACSRDNPRLLNITQDGEGPDEFMILPTRPLDMPQSFAELPPPTPGGINRADRVPKADAIAALGGSIDRASRDNGSLVRHAARFGIAAGIRDTLAAEDLAFRRRNDGRLLERLFNVNTYHRAYRDVALDQYEELARMRRAGIRTPAAPPAPADDE
ncbi:MAG: DUF3035 domain-containing protein [Rhodobacteraceae bacterium]|nr:DUF3035 domain-containing protein [Paracoccaceae bacterium]